MGLFFDSFHIGNYRGLRDVEFSGMSATNVLVGANNSGKTSVLEALAIYCNPLNERTWLSVLSRREERSGRGARFDDLLWLFSGAEKVIHLYSRGEHSLRELRASASTFTHLENVGSQTNDEEYEDSAQIEVSGTAIEVTAFPHAAHDEAHGIEIARLEFWDGIPIRKSAHKPFAEAKSLTPFSHRIEPLQLRSLTKATMEGWKGDVLDLLRQIDPAILDLEILSPEGNLPVMYVNYRGVGLAPLSILGDGLRRVVSIALAVTNLRKGVLLIDEIESAIHVSALETVFPWLMRSCAKNQVQLFATTHSLEALDALLTPSTSIEEMVCFRLNRPDNSERVERLSGDLMRRLRFERGLDVRQSR